MAGEVRSRRQGVLSAQALSLGIGHDGQGYLRELGQVQHALRVAEGGAAHGEFRRVLIDDLPDAKAQVRAGMRIGAAPGLACRRGSLAVILAHAHCLDTLAGVNVGRGRRGEQGLAAGDDLAVDAAGDFEGLVDALAADALDGDLNVITELHHAVHGVGPAHYAAVAAGHLLRRSGEPHAVHERCLQVDELGRVIGGMNRVIVTRDQREWSHILRGGDGGAVDEGARSRHHLGGRLPAAPLRRWAWCCGTGSAAADGKAVHLRGHDVARGVVLEFQLHRHDAPGSRFLHGGAGGGDVDLAAVGKLLQRHPHVDDVVQVHRVEQALDDRVTVLQATGAERGIDGRPAGANKHVRGAGLFSRGIAAGHRAVRRQ